LAYRVTFIRGDGTGPEISEAVQRVLEATGVEFEWDWQDAGADVYEEEGTPLPDRVVESIKERGLAIKGPITTPVGSGFRSVNVALRKELDLFACLRPCKAYEGVRTRFPDTDIVVVRENHEDLYAGVEYEKGEEDTERLRQFIKETNGTELREDIGVSIKPISVTGTKRIVREAFEYAKAYGRSKVTAVHKANIMKFTDGLFLHTAQEVAEEEYPDIEFEDRIVDNLCNQLVSRPEEYDVIVLPNLYGDIVSDLGAGLIGGLGMAPSADIGDRHAMFQPCHGTAPDIMGQGKANPTAMILSTAMMLDWLADKHGVESAAEAGERIERAVDKAYSGGIRPMEFGGSNGTVDIAKAVLAAL
jgi:isocitrate dehydrogenase (NAD+)